MERSVFNFISISCLIIFPAFLKASNPPAVKWTVKNPFEQKVFIENKGQYQLQNNAESKDILFSASLNDLDYYFTTNSIWIKRVVKVKRTAEEIEQFERQSGETDEDENNRPEFEYKTIEEFHRLQFIGVNPLTRITGENGVSQHYNFTLPGNETVKANAYEKIMYRNLYPGIDMEFYFPTNKQGFEYSFIVHPGADIAQIKMMYPLNEGIHLNSEGNLEIKSSYGLFTDYAPIGIQTGTLKQIDCSFTLSNGIIQFKTGSYNTGEDLVIDPWETTPEFASNDRAYDVDWDFAGNCYVYGGTPPFQVLKFDSTGTLLWSSAANFSNDLGIYGDFVVDKRSQSVYVVEGYGFTGGKVMKLNSSGTQVALFNGNSNLIEMWRVAFSPLINEIIVAGGGTSYPSYTGCSLDTNLSVFTPAYVVNPGTTHDMWGITLDNAGNCYMATTRSHSDPTHNDNIVLKLVPPTLAPALWTISDHYKIWEVTTVEYVGANGFNGMTVSDTNLYTYDSYTVKKWGTTNGNLLDSLNVNGDTTASIYWGGLTSDSCGNIFIGSHDTIKEFNSSLTLINYIVAPDSIYDVSRGNNNLLYACGAGFVSAFKLTPHMSSPTNVKLCLGNSTTLTAAGATTYSWSPLVGLNTTTGASVIATPSATTIYTVICTGSLSCLSNILDTFKVAVTVDTLPLPVVKATPGSSTICFGNSITINASGAANYKWSPSVGLKSTSGDSVVATPAVSTTYTVIGTDTNGCYDIGQSAITVDTLPQVSVSPNYSFICNGQSDTLYARGQPAYQWSPSTGLSATTGATVTASPTLSTIYVVTVEGSNGCVNTAQSIIYVSPIPNVIINRTTQGVCPNDSISLSFSGAFSYQWSPSAGLDSVSADSVIAKPVTSTTYTIIGTSINGCSDTLQTVISIGFPTVIISPPIPNVCLGQSTSLFASGANTYQWSPSVGLNSTTGDTIIANPTITTTYYIIGSNGCPDTVTTIVTVDSLPDVIALSSSACEGQSTPLTASGANNYQWSPATGLNVTTGDSVIASPTITSTYQVIGTNSFGCKDTTTADVIVSTPPNKPSVKRSGDTLFSSARQGNQWYRNDTLLKGATDSIYIVTIAGSYTVSVINAANGCSNTSDSIYYNPTGINQLSIINWQVSIYPNPFSKEIVIRLSSQVEDLKDWNLQITDVLGRLVYSRASLNYSNVIDLSDKPSGVYFISINSKASKSVYPVIRQE